MDYEEMLLQISDILRAHNRHHMNTPDHEQAVKAIREIVTPKGKWIETDRFDEIADYMLKCPKCNEDTLSSHGNFCPNCGADMRGDV